MPKHPIYSKDATVYLCTGVDKFEALQAAIDQSGFIDNLTRTWQASDKTKAEYKVSIKPNIMTAANREPDSPTYTDPAMVEYLIAKMRDQGFEQFTVVEAENVYNYSYYGRRVGAVAEMVGYTQRGYSVHSLTEDHVKFDYGGLLGMHVAGRVWLEADYRISFAKNKTHWQCFYTGTIKNLYGCLPLWDKMHYYHGSRRGANIEFSDAAVLSANCIPANFGFLDAWMSGDGLTGHVRDADPNPTHTIFASENIFAIDWVQGEKMQIAPMSNYMIQKGLAMWGQIDIKRVGDMTPWHPWTNVKPIFVNLMDIGEEWYKVSRFFSHTLAEAQDPRFTPTSTSLWYRTVHAALYRIDRLFTTGTSKADALPYEMPAIVGSE